MTKSFKTKYNPETKTPKQRITEAEEHAKRAEEKSKANEAYWFRHRVEAAKREALEQGKTSIQDLAASYLTKQNYSGGFRYFINTHGLEQVLDWAHEIFEERIQKSLGEGKLTEAEAKKKLALLPEFIVQREQNIKDALEKMGEEKLNKSGWFE